MKQRENLLTTTRIPRNPFRISYVSESSTCREALTKAAKDNVSQPDGLVVLVVNHGRLGA